MWLKESASKVFENKAVQSLTFWAWAEWINMLVKNALWIWHPAFWDVFWTVKWLVDFVLSNKFVSPLITSHSALTTWLSSVWAWLLSNKFFKDLGLYESWWIKSPKNLLRYILNAWAMIWAYSAWTAAAPYLMAGAWAYFAWKYGWEPSVKVAKFIWEWLKRVWKAWINMVTEPIASAINTVTSPIRWAYSWLVKDLLLLPNPVKAATAVIWK